MSASNTGITKRGIDFYTTPGSTNPPALPSPSDRRWGWSSWFPM
jgi:hypothetical protein